MTAAKIMVGESTFESLAAVSAEREIVVAKLFTIFTGYDPGSIEALYPYEQDIVRLFNRYQALSEAIDRHTQIEQRNENIRTAWQLVRELKKDSNS